MDIYEAQDMAGLDIAWSMRKRRAASIPREDTYVAIAKRLCENGWFGRKTGRGWYDYADQKAVPSDDTARLIAEERRLKGIATQRITEDQIMDRKLTRLRAEAERVLAEGIAARPGDIDVVMVNGNGFPRWRGGPLFVS